MEHIEANRRTGRTTRMLEAVIAQAKVEPTADQSNYVIVMSSNGIQAKSLLKRCKEMVDADGFAEQTGPDKLEIVGGGSIAFLPVGTTGWDWHRMTTRGSWPSIKHFVDHESIEMNFGYLFDEMHRWDLPEDETP